MSVVRGRRATASWLLVALLLSGCVPRRRQLPEQQPLVGSQWTAFTPAPITSATIIERPFAYFTVGFSPTTNNPSWATYVLPQALRFPTGFHRRSHFISDTGLPRAHRVMGSTYTGSGYSRGHMAPASVIYGRFGQAAADSTFIMSNVCPQLQTLNNGTWSALENAIATGASSLTGMTVCVGPIYDARPAEFPAGSIVPKVRVPIAFYALMWWNHDASSKSVTAVVMNQNAPTGHSPRAFIAPIRDIENATGLDWHSWMTPAQQDAIELHRNPWFSP